MLTLTKARLDALTENAKATECRMAWLKDRMVQFTGSLKVNRELTYNPLVRRAVAALGRGRQPLNRVVENLSKKDPLLRAIVEQTLYALVNAGFVTFERNGKETVLEAKPRKVAELLSGSTAEGETMPLAAYVWFRNRTWTEDPHFSRDERRLKRALEVPSDKFDASSEASKKEIESLVLQHPPLNQLFGEVHGAEEQRNELLEKAGLLSVKVKVVGLDVKNADFIEEFWLSQCFIFLGIPGTCGCVVRVLKPSRLERRHSFEDAVNQIVEKNQTFRERLTQQSEKVEII